MKKTEKKQMDSEQNKEQEIKEEAPGAAEKPETAAESQEDLKDSSQTSQEDDKVSEEKAEEPKAEEKAEEKKTEEEKPQEDLETKYLRLAADFQNYRKRTEKEKADVYAFANEKIVTELLGVIDNFERAMESRPEEKDNKFAEGMELILKQLKGVLDKSHVTEIEAEGKPFDPNFHNAVLTQKEEGKESGTVIKVLQKGYKLNDKVIRPSMVAVAE